MPSEQVLPEQLLQIIKLVDLKKFNSNKQTCTVTRISLTSRYNKTQRLTVTLSHLKYRAKCTLQKKNKNPVLTASNKDWRTPCNNRHATPTSDRSSNHQTKHTDRVPSKQHTLTIAITVQQSAFVEEFSYNLCRRQFYDNN